MKIDINDDGRVDICGVDQEMIEKGHGYHPSDRGAGGSGSSTKVK